jgi:hypothetical protein
VKIDGSPFGKSSPGLFHAIRVPLIRGLGRDGSAVAEGLALGRYCFGSGSGAVRTPFPLATRYVNAISGRAIIRGGTREADGEGGDSERYLFPRSAVLNGGRARRDFRGSACRVDGMIGHEAASGQIRSIAICRLKEDVKVRAGQRPR